MLYEVITEEDARLLKSVAYQVAVGLRNSRLYFQAQQQAEREAMINEITLKIRGANSIENVLRITSYNVCYTKLLRIF